jgi:hypothetical protein
MIELFFISNQLNILACSNQDLQQERMTKAFPSPRYDSLQVHISMPIPINLQVIPYSATEVTLKEQTHHIPMTP